MTQNPTSVPAQAAELVRGFEGLRLRVYPDPGTGGAPWTQGYGSTKDLAGNPFGPKSPAITVEAAGKLLERDMAWAAADVGRLVQTPLSEASRAALVSFVYNVGTKNFAASTLLRLLNAGDLVKAADEFPKWNLAAGKVLAGLVARRAAERRVFLSGLPK